MNADSKYACAAWCGGWVVQTDRTLKCGFHLGSNITDLSGLLQTKPYLRPDSDIVSLLVLEHQTAMQNTLTRASLDCRRMLAYQKNLQAELMRRIYSRLVRALDPASPDSRYDYLPAEERSRISKILKQTHPDFRHLRG